MSQKPTLHAFVEKAISYPYCCELKETQIAVSGPRGPVVWKYLKRGEYLAPLPDIGDDEQLTTATMRSLVAQLKLPPLEFWFVL